MAERAKAAHARLNIEVIDDAGDWSWADDAETLVEAAAAEVAAEQSLAFRRAEVTVVLSSDANVAALNGRYRGKPKPTNVLSFPADGTGKRSGFLGDVILACETILREADEQDIPKEHHLQHLVVHGILHLLGLDHETPEAAEHMEALEIQILARLSIANPYTAPLETAKT